MRFRSLSLSLALSAVSLATGCALDSAPPSAPESQGGVFGEGAGDPAPGASSSTDGLPGNGTVITPSPGTPVPGGNPAAPTSPVIPQGGPGSAPQLRIQGTADAAGFIKQNTGTVDYYIRMPKGYDANAPTPLPMFIALHGCGDSAYNFATWAAAPPQIRSSQGYFAISVGGRDGACWDAAADGALVDSVLTHARARVYAHDQKIFIGGFSSGGVLAYKHGLANADRFAGILIENSGLYAVSGSNEVTPTLQSADWRIHIAHAANRSDTVFPLSEVQKDWQKMQSLGFPITTTVREGTHDGTADAWVQNLLPNLMTWQKQQ